ncbi:unnamed protein product [Ambrosiozyma monospora]|uniref:Unnamed protein product n=1 Tax=Ambrosiozyma monospora TaxID=43982 RepID=A0ACB5T6V6_AMBMO|nr:unnamed protein product [Ambrosiozyma monospora]
MSRSGSAVSLKEKPAKTSTPVSSMPPTPKKTPTNNNSSPQAIKSTSNVRVNNELNRLSLPRLPENGMSEFRHLVDIIFEDEKPAQSSEPAKTPVSAAPISTNETPSQEALQSQQIQQSKSKSSTQSYEEPHQVTIFEDETHLSLSTHSDKMTLSSGTFKKFDTNNSATLGSAATNESLVTDNTSASSVDYLSTSSFSLDPKVKTRTVSGGSRNASGASIVLEKFGVKMNAYGTLNSTAAVVTDSTTTSEVNSTGRKDLRSLVAMQKKSSLEASTKRLSSLRKSGSSSVRNLNSFLEDGRNMKVDDFNSTHRETNRLSIPKAVDRTITNNSSDSKTLGTDRSMAHSEYSYDVDYSLHSAVQVPISSPNAQHFPGGVSNGDKESDDKFADAESDRFPAFSPKLNQSNSELKVHRKADSAASTQENLSKFIQKPNYKAARCSLLANSNYEMPEESKSGKKLNLTPEKKRASLVKPIIEGAPNDGVSIFDDPVEDDTIPDGRMSSNLDRENTTIFDDVNALPELEEIPTKDLVNMRKQRASMVTIENHFPGKTAFDSPSQNVNINYAAYLKDSNAPPQHQE